MNETRPKEPNALVAEFAGSSLLPFIEQSLACLGRLHLTPFWFGSRTMTGYVYGQLLPPLLPRLLLSPCKDTDLLTGVLVHFACREPLPNTQVLYLGPRSPSLLALAGFPKRWSNLTLGPAASGQASGSGPASSWLEAQGDMIIADVALPSLVRALRPRSVSTLFFDLTADPDADLRRLATLRETLLPETTLVVHGAKSDLHGFFTRIHHQAQCRMWAQLHAPEPAGRAEDATLFAYFELADPAHLSQFHAGGEPLAPSAEAVTPPARASGGPYHFADREALPGIASRRSLLADARIVPFRNPAFISGTDTMRASWRGHFGMQPEDWLHAESVTCPALECLHFDNLRVVGTSVLVTDDDHIFEANLRSLTREFFASHGSTMRSDIRLHGKDHIVSERAAAIGQFVPGETLVFGDAGIPMHYHFLFDLLPRLWVRERSEVGVRKIAVPNTITQEQVEILRTHYGIPADELVLWSADGAACCFEHAVVVPTFVSDMWAMPETILSPRKALRFAAPPKDSAYRNVKRLYVSRRDVQDGRPLLNEDEVVTRLTAMGFTEIFPGRFSYAEEMHLFQNAEIIVGPFGSGMANIMFCQPGSRIVILQPDSTNWRILSFVMGFLGLDYGYVFGESFRRRARAHNTEWLIDVDDVCRRVASLL